MYYQPSQNLISWNRVTGGKHFDIFPLEQFFEIRTGLD